MNHSFIVSDWLIILERTCFTMLNRYNVNRHLCSVQIFILFTYNLVLLISYTTEFSLWFSSENYFISLVIFSMIQKFSNSVDKESSCNAGDPGSIPGWGRSPGEGNGNPLQYYCLENPMDRGAWWATVHGAARVRHDLVTKQS